MYARRIGRDESWLERSLATSFSTLMGRLARTPYQGQAGDWLAGVAAVVIFVLTVAGVLTASLGVWILVSVLFLGGVQLISVGILGRYVARMHEQTLQRPLYLVNRVIASPLDTAPRQGAGTGGTSSRSR